MKRKFAKLLAVGLVLGLVFSLAPIAGLVGASPANVCVELGKTGDASAEWSTAKSALGYSVHLNSGPNTNGEEARIVIPMPAGITLSDIDSIAWSVWAVAGYPPHVDIYLDADGDGIVGPEDVLTAEMYYNNASYVFGLVNWCNQEVIYGGWLQTFELTPTDGFDVVDDTSLLWLCKFGGGPGDAPAGTLAQWKVGTLGSDSGNDLPGGTVIDGTAPVLRLEIEVDNWQINSEAYVDDVVLVLDGGAPITYELEPFTVDVTAPDSVYVCEDFEVTANIKNLGNEASNFKAIIDPGANAEWVSGGVADLSDHPQYEETLQPCETWTVTWMLHCEAEGLTDVTVKAKCDQATAWIENTVTVTQVNPTLGVVITEPDDLSVEFVGENFVVTATVESTGPNTNVVATIDPDTSGTFTDAEWISGGDPDQPGYPIPIGDMAHGDEAEVSWTLRCTAPNPADVEVTATGDGGVTGDDQVNVAQTTPLHPILTALGAVSVSPSGPFHPGQTFSVDATITNDGDEPALDCSATISFSNELAGLVLGDLPKKDLGDIQPNGAHHANWTVKCNGPGLVLITVTPAGDDDVTGESIADDELVSGSVVVQQLLTNDLGVWISLPADGTHTGVGETFDIDFDISNWGYAGIEGIEATLVIGGGGNASVAVDTIPIGTLASGASTSDSFAVECTGPDDEENLTTFTVNVSGTSAKTGDTVEASDEVSVYQKYLVVEFLPPIDPIQKGPDTHVNILVTNYHDEPLTGVLAWIEIIDGPVYLDTPPTGEQTIGTIDSGLSDDVPDNWHIEWTGYGTATIKVTARGITVVGNETIRNYAEMTIERIEGAELEVTIDPETCQWYGHGEVFDVTATISNTGDDTATNVSARLCFKIQDEVVATAPGGETHFSETLNNVPITGTISVTDGVETFTDADGDGTLEGDKGGGGTIDYNEGDLIVDFNTAPDEDVVITADYKTLGLSAASILTINPVDLLDDIASDGSDIAEWEVQCTGPCDVNLEVDVTGISASCLNELVASADETVHQLPLEVTVDPLDPVYTCTTFCVTACLWNTSDDCEDYPYGYDVLGVTAAIAFDPVSGATLVTGESATKTIGTVGGGQMQEVEWTVHCDRPGEVIITVTATTSTNPLTGLPLGYEVSTSGSNTVVQIHSLTRYDVPLAKGWNYMSLPLIPKDNDIVEVLAPIADKVNNVWTYVAGDLDDPWKVYAPGILEEFTEMNDGVGYVIRAINPAVLTGQGYDLPTEPYVLPPEYALQQGWNLVGFKTMDFDDSTFITNADTMAARHYLGNLEVSGGQARIIGDEARYFRTYLPGTGWRVLTDSDLMLVGKGYWLYASLEYLSIVPPIER